jgi:hypothetical protein
MPDSIDIYRAEYVFVMAGGSIDLNRAGDLFVTTVTLGRVYFTEGCIGDFDAVRDIESIQRAWSDHRLRLRADARPLPVAGNLFDLWHCLQRLR